MYTKDITFHSHKNHNPNSDILVYKIDKDTNITYGLNIKGNDKGKEFMEIYVGENYVVGSKKRSYSRFFDSNNIPKKYKSEWNTLKAYYNNFTK